MGGSQNKTAAPRSVYSRRGSRRSNPKFYYLFIILNLAYYIFSHIIGMFCDSGFRIHPVRQNHQGLRIRQVLRIRQDRLGSRLRSC